MGFGVRMNLEIIFVFLDDEEGVSPKIMKKDLNM
jgi:hypothetical protein